MLHVFPKSRATTVKCVHCPSVPLPFPPSNQTQNQGKGVKEGAHINHLLLALGNCIEALSGKGGAAPSLSIFKTANSWLLKVSYTVGQRGAWCACCWYYCPNQFSRDGPWMSPCAVFIWLGALLWGFEWALLHRWAVISITLQPLSVSSLL